MKYKNLIALFFILLLSSGCSAAHGNTEGQKGFLSLKFPLINKQESKPLKNTKKSNNSSNNIIKSPNQGVKPQKKDTVTEDVYLPWKNYPVFTETIKKENLFLMAYYKATLNDPLPGELKNITHAANLLAGTYVKPGQIFSQNKTIGPYIPQRGYFAGPMYKGNKVVTAYGGGVCKIASLLFNVAILSDLKIIERYTHSMTVPYVPPGQDATVYYGVKDFKFLNNTKGNILIWSKMVGKTLYLAMYGTQKPPKITWHHKTLKVIPYTTIYTKNYKLQRGQSKVVYQGHEGYIVSSYIRKVYADGSAKTIKMGKRYYDPCPSYVEIN